MAGRFETDPNPRVGALVVRAGEVVGRGWHRCYGGPHAEVEALREAGERARGADLFVTLEPCSTAGKTPPCTDAIVRAGIRRVWFGAIDPDPRHRGAGARALLQMGVAVEGPAEGAASPAARSLEALLARFRRHLARRRPWIVAKWAMTLDGRVATSTGAARWISGAAARARTHRLRGRVDAIAVGSGTVLRDSPRLTARGGHAPLRARRVVFDRRLRIPADWPALGDGGPDVLVVHGPGADAARARRLEERGAHLVAVDAEGDVAFVRAALARLRELGIGRLLVEGGPTLLGALFDARVVDAALVFVAPKVFGGGDAPAAVSGIGRSDVAHAVTFDEGCFARAGEDAAFRGYVRDAAD